MPTRHALTFVAAAASSDATRRHSRGSTKCSATATTATTCSSASGRSSRGSRRGHPQPQGMTCRHCCVTVGDSLVSSVGGASGPLYGAAFAEAGFAARGVTGVGRTAALATLLEAAAAGLARRGHCTVGDKTIYDTLAPASIALRAAVDRGADERTAIRGDSAGRGAGHAKHHRPGCTAGSGPPPGRAVARPPRPGRGIVLAAGAGAGNDWAG